MEEIIRAGNERLLMKAKASGREVPRERIDDFLARLAECCNMSRAAREAGVSKSMIYRLRTRDADFAAAWVDAIEVGYQRLELGLIEAALARVDRRAAESATDGDVAPPIIESMTMEQAIQLLGRYRATVRSGKVQSNRRGAARVPTSEETDEAILSRLAILRRQRGWDKL
ncbi:hypothetical protein [Sphingopyxis sp. H115]|uniref:hypothetical protein n=1 Tax=Sphingopyxis sp. H115 TaxID=1759073 RepID=UPI0007377BC1|nr:hypothetical protein [Sphingopyxis sp. H115]KTE06009.1 hypothetical protein ATE71_17390 [Sphingopyxis sp. H115]